MYLKVDWLLVVEDVAFPVVSGCGSRGLVPECWAPFDGKGLVSVDKGLADREGNSRRTLEVQRNERSGHWRVAWQEQGSPFLNRTRESGTQSHI